MALSVAGRSRVVLHLARKRYEKIVAIIWEFMSGSSKWQGETSAVDV